MNTVSILFFIAECAVFWGTLSGALCRPRERVGDGTRSRPCGDQAAVLAGAKCETRGCLTVLVSRVGLAPDALLEPDVDRRSDMFNCCECDNRIERCSWMQSIKSSYDSNGCLAAEARHRGKDIPGSDGLHERP